MSLAVVITERARRELVSAVLYIAEDSETQALLMADKLEAACQELADNALRYPLVPYHEASGIRRRVVSSYGVFYRIKADTVEVLHILHGARDLERILFPEG